SGLRSDAASAACGRCGESPSLADPRSQPGTWPPARTNRRTTGARTEGPVRPDGIGSLARRRDAVRAQQVLLDEVVPAAAAAHLDDIHPKLTERHRQRGQLRQPAGLPGGLLELVAVDVVDMDEVLATADGTTVPGRLAVELRRAFQVRRGIAHLIGAHPSGVDLTQQGTSPKRVVDDLPLRAHVDEGTRSRASRRPWSLMVIGTRRGADS